MFDYIKMHAGKDRIERCATVWGKYTEDVHSLACGESYSLENDWNNNCYKINKITYLGGTPRAVETVASGKEEVLTLQEFKNWLMDNDIKDAFADYQKLTLN